MRVLLCTLVILAAQAKAFESHYIVNQDMKKGQLEMTYRQAQQMYQTRGAYLADRGDESVRALELAYSHSLTEVTSAGISTQFINRSYHSDQGDRSNTVSGLGDIQMFLKSGTVFNPLTLTYGTHVQLSPSDANAPYANRSSNNHTNGNDFSGTNSLAPFVGIESYLGQVALGGRFVMAYYSAQSMNSDIDSRYLASPETFVFRTEVFVEFPVFNKVDVGLNIMAGNNKTGLSNYLDRGDEYLARVYGQYKVSKETAVTASISSQAVIVPLQRNSSDFTLGLQRSL